MSAGIFAVPYLMTQSDYERLVTGSSFSEISEPVNFAVDEPILAIERDGFWVVPDEQAQAKN